VAGQVPQVEQRLRGIACKQQSHDPLGNDLSHAQKVSQRKTTARKAKRRGKQTAGKDEATPSRVQE